MPYRLTFPFAVCMAACATFIDAAEPVPPPKRIYQNTLKKLDNPPPLLADYPEFFQPIEEETRYEAPVLVDDPAATIDVRAWRFSYNARGIIEMPNRLNGAETAVIMVHPWGSTTARAGRLPNRPGFVTSALPPRTTSRRNTPSRSSIPS